MSHCEKCGSKIPHGARFCSNCGTVIAIERRPTALTNIAAKAVTTNMRAEHDMNAEVFNQAQGLESNEGERIVFMLRPTLLFIKTGYVAAALCSLLLIVLLALANVPTLLSVLMGLALLLVPAFYHLRQNAIRYTLTDSKIEIDRGLLSRTTRNIPLRNVQDVTVSASIAQRLLGIGNLLIDNASETGGKTVLANIRRPRQHADLLLRELRRWH